MPVLFANSRRQFFLRRGPFSIHLAEEERDGCFILLVQCLFLLCFSSSRCRGLVFNSDCGVSWSKSLTFYIQSSIEYIGANLQYKTPMLLNRRLKFLASREIIFIYKYKSIISSLLLLSLYILTDIYVKVRNFYRFIQAKKLFIPILLYHCTYCVLTIIPHENRG